MSRDETRTSRTEEAPLAAKLERLTELQARIDAAREEYDREYLKILTEKEHSTSEVSRALGISVHSVRQRRERIRLRFADRAAGYRVGTEAA